jgi:ketosteroid isomerase-like protein
VAEIDPLQRILVVQECTQLIARFAERNDARDADALADMFVADGVFVRPTRPDEPYKGREAIRVGFRARPAGLITRHVCTNVVVTAISTNEASVHSYILLFTGAMTEGATLPVKADAKQLLGAFKDRIVRDTDGVWKFRERIGSLAMTVGG